MAVLLLVIILVFLIATTVLIAYIHRQEAASKKNEAAKAAVIMAGEIWAALVMEVLQLILKIIGHHQVVAADILEVVLAVLMAVVSEQALEDLLLYQVVKDALQ